MTTARLAVATAFGRHSPQVWRAIIGATWTLPFRYAIFAGQLAAVAIVQAAADPSPHAAALAMTAGVLVGWVASLVDRLLVEFALFPAVKRFFTEPAP